MKAGISKRAIAGSHFDKVLINTYCLKTKKVLFTGDIEDTAKFVGTYREIIASYLRTKYRYKKTYCFRYAKTNQ